MILKYPPSQLPPACTILNRATVSVVSASPNIPVLSSRYVPPDTTSNGTWSGLVRTWLRSRSTMAKEYVDSSKCLCGSSSRWQRSCKSTGRIIRWAFLPISWAWLLLNGICVNLQRQNIWLISLRIRWYQGQLHSNFWSKDGSFSIGTCTQLFPISTERLVNH